MCKLSELEWITCVGSSRVSSQARPLAEALGAKVTWDEEKRAVIISKVVTPTVTDSSAPFVGTVKVNGETIAASLSMSEAGDTCVPFRTVAGFTTINSPKDSTDTNFAVEIDGARFTKNDLWSHQGLSFVCAATMTQLLKWTVGWNKDSLTLTITK